MSKLTRTSHTPSIQSSLQPSTHPSPHLSSQLSTFWLCMDLLQNTCKRILTITAVLTRKQFGGTNQELLIDRTANLMINETESQIMTIYQSSHQSCVWLPKPTYSIWEAELSLPNNCPANPAYNHQLNLHPSQLFSHVHNNPNELPYNKTSRLHNSQPSN